MNRQRPREFKSVNLEEVTQRLNFIGNFNIVFSGLIVPCHAKNQNATVQCKKRKKKKP